MIHMSTSRIKNGLAIGMAAIELFYKNPILLLYGVLPVLIILPWRVYTVFNSVAILLLPIACVIFCRFCLAHHALHILRKQPSSLSESFKQIMDKYKPVLAWILVEIASITALHLISHTVVNIYAKELFLLLTTIAIIAMGTCVIIPIIATENKPLVLCGKRAAFLVRHNLLTYVTIQVVFISIMVVAFLLFAYFFKPNFQPYTWLTTISCALIFVLPLLTVANTLFYYELYVKRELELEEIFFTTQI